MKYIITEFFRTSPLLKGKASLWPFFEKVFQSTLNLLMVKGESPFVKSMFIGIGNSQHYFS